MIVFCETYMHTKRCINKVVERPERSLEALAKSASQLMPGAAAGAALLLTMPYLGCWPARVIHAQHGLGVHPSSRQR